MPDDYAGLDVMMRRELLDMGKKQLDSERTVVLTTHNLEEAGYFCDKFVVIDNGKILAMNSVENVKELYGGRLSRSQLEMEGLRECFLGRELGCWAEAVRIEPSPERSDIKPRTRAHLPRLFF